jgi:hypothetical protein
VEAYCAAVLAGASPVEFWSLTPYLARLAVASSTEGRNTNAWITACLIRAKKMPKLSELTGRQEPRTNVENRIKAALSTRKKKK